MTIMARYVHINGKPCRSKPTLVDVSKQKMSEAEIEATQMAIARRTGIFWITDIISPDGYGKWIRLRCTDGLREGRP